MGNKLLWTPSEERIAASNATAFMQQVREQYGFDGRTFHDLWHWSVSNSSDFWNSVWDFCSIIGDKGSDRLSNGAAVFWEHRYFPDAQLNFSENLLRRQDDCPALIFWGEEKVRRILTWKDLYEAVARTAAALRRLGI
ncbi:MAG: acetoacetate--CoA ligase, partial [Holosporaceae bacterium]|nr:acetoacetate--CoA ligase [Holosporaceae bacterium]